ncbi:MAG TPA: hypothetical protein VMF09_17010 [Solirubrobacteraceae bacterium]|nr:hypothetical protein [Solirubrobacteraceae bacterium]
MSSPIMPVQGPLDSPGSTPQAMTEIDDVGTTQTTSEIDAAAVQRAASGLEDVPSFIDELASPVSALSIDIARGGPPQEVLEEVSAAAQAAERLRESGYELRFFDALPGERTRIELHDAQGEAVGELSIAAALALAAGEPASSWPV